MKQKRSKFQQKIKLTLGFIFYDLRMFHFFNGLAIGLLFYFYSENVYEQQLFEALAGNIRNELPLIKTHAEDSILIRSLRLTNELEKNRMNIFSNAKFEGFKAEYLQPVTFDLMTGQGACGSNAYVLGRLLMEFNYPIRFGQMKVNGIYGGHIILEAWFKGKWVALDPSYNLYFKTRSGDFASFAEVQADWENYKYQAPKNYNMAYDYADIRYANWDKIPVIMPILKGLLSTLLGSEKVASLSLRVFILKKFHFLFWFSLIFYCTFHIIRVYIYRKQIRTWLLNVKNKYYNFSE